jgi:dTDP-glucose pyrophosphorylase/predicted transcriptional regulator
MYLNIPIENLCVAPDVSLREAVAVLQIGAKQIALVVDENRRLLGTITDGDLRRAVLGGTAMEASAESVMQRSFIAGHTGMNTADIFSLMQNKLIRHVPLLNQEGILADLVWISDLIKQEQLDLSAVVMAGGFGKRLLPLTESLPKPMLPVGDRPVMEHIIDNLRAAGIRDVNVTTHFMPEKIINYFGNGRKFGVKINYVAEDRPLGTAGALGLMPVPDRPMLVVNGDIMTQVDYRAMHAFHREHNADLTVGVRQYELQIPYGVMVCEGAEVRKLSEKPKHKFLVNAGIYMLEPSVHGFIPRNERFDMTDLIDLLIQKGRRVVSFPVMEYWLDIGQPADYQQAQDDQGKRRLSA